MRESAETFVKFASVVSKLTETSVKSENYVCELAEIPVETIKLTCKSAQTFAESARKQQQKWMTRTPCLREAVE